MSRTGIVARRAPPPDRARGVAAKRAELAGGRLIVVTCVDMGRVGLVVHAAVRRLARGQGLVVAEPVVTRALPAGGGTLVTRNGFACLERDGAIVLGWSDSGRSCGYGAVLIERLTRGESVICAVPAGLQLESAARLAWHDVKFLSLEPGTQSLRAALSTGAALARTAGTRRRDIDRLLTDTADQRIVDHGCLASAVRAMTSALEAILPAPSCLPLAVADAANPIVPAAQAAARAIAARKLRTGSSRRRPPADRADKPQVRATLAT